MILGRLNNAALALYKVLNSAGIKHGIFGGYAINTLGGPKESKDIDCIVSASRQQIIALMDGKEGFQFINQSREDYVAFFWSDKPDRRHAVLVEIFVEGFAGARIGMAGIQPEFKQVTGLSMGVGYTAHLDPVYIFKGSLRAAATRAKFHDSADLRWLEEHFPALLQQRRGEFSLEYAGLAMKRYPELNLSLARIEVNVAGAKRSHCLWIRLIYRSLNEATYRKVSFNAPEHMPERSGNPVSIGRTELVNTSHRYT